MLPSRTPHARPAACAGHRHPTRGAQRPGRPAPGRSSRWAPSPGPTPTSPGPACGSPTALPRRRRGPSALRRRQRNAAQAPSRGTGRSPRAVARQLAHGAGAPAAGCAGLPAIDAWRPLVRMTAPPDKPMRPCPRVQARPPSCRANRGRERADPRPRRRARHGLGISIFSSTVVWKRRKFEYVARASIAVVQLPPIDWRPRLVDAPADVK